MRRHDCMMTCYKTTVVFLLVVTVKVVGSVHGEGCEDGWQHFQHCCYSFHVNQTTHQAAEAACQALGSNLASVWSQEERTFITDILWQPRVSSKEFAWFGLHGTPGNAWVYPDNSNVTMKAGVLSSSSGAPAVTVNKCGAFMGTGSLSFLDCGDVAQGFVCKKPLPRVFAKSSLLNHTIPDNSPPPTRGAELFERVWPPLLLEFPQGHHLAESGATDSETGCAFRCFTVHGCNAFRVNCIVQEKCTSVTCTLLA